MKLFACLLSSLLLVSLTACGSPRLSPAGVSTNRLTASNAGTTTARTTAPVSAQTYARTVVTPAPATEESEETTHPASLSEEDTWE